MPPPVRGGQAEMDGLGGLGLKTIVCGLSLIIGGAFGAAG